MCTGQLSRIPELEELGSRVIALEMKEIKPLVSKETKVIDLQLAKVTIDFKRGDVGNKDREGPCSQNYTGETI